MVETPHKVPPMRLPRALIAAAALIVLLPGSALAWGNYGHRMIGQLGAESYGPQLPAFLKTRKAVEILGELSREPDRRKGSGQPADADGEASHFLDVSLDGTILGGPRLDAMPRDRKDYEAALQKIGENSWHAGYLYYAIVDGWQELALDFAYWRVLTLGEKSARTSAERAYYKRDREARELLILRDIGYWSHFVGDGSQPLHLSDHFNGWGPGPNPSNYTQDKVHAPIEARFVERNITKEMVRARMSPRQTCTPPIQTCVTRDLLQTASRLEPTYELYGQGGFNDGDARGIAFSLDGLAAGASRLRDYVEAAWAESLNHKVGFPNPISPSEVEAGKPIDSKTLLGIEKDLYGPRR